MPKLHSAVIGTLLTALAFATPASADGYRNHFKPYGYLPGPELVESPGNGAAVEVTIRYRAAPAYGYGAAYLPRPPSLWRQREVAYDAIFTPDKRIIYDSGLAAQSRAAAQFYGYQPRVYYRAPAYGSIKDYPPPVGFVGPFVDPAGSCGTFRYWNGAECVDARYYSRYKNPYRWYGLHK